MEKTDLIKIAQHHAAADQFHSYTQVPGFMPHEWVVAALQDAYDAGHTDAAQAMRQPRGGIGG